MAGPPRDPSAPALGAPHVRELDRSRSPSAHPASADLADGRGRVAPRGLAQTAVASGCRADPSIGEVP
eukprot:12012919-Alexandrium_andersonii.AAC.1